MFRVTLRSKKAILSILKLNTSSKYMIHTYIKTISNLSTRQVFQHKHQMFKNVLLFNGSYYQRNFHLSILNKLNVEDNNIQLVKDDKKDEIQIEDGTVSSVDKFNNISKIENIFVRRNVLAQVEDCEDVDFIAPQLKPTFNLAAYVDKSDVLKSLIHLGVNISRWDKDKDICSEIIRKDFETDIKPYVFFLHNLGIPVDGIGKFITGNPYMFRHSLEDIQSRIDYLISKRFTSENIVRILSVSSTWINHSATDIDKRLGDIQRKFKLVNKEVMQVVLQDPKLILYKMHNPSHLERQFRTIEGRMGFSNEEQKQFILKTPRLYRSVSLDVVNRFNIVHNELGLSHEMIVQFPKILGLRSRKLRERNKFLKFIGKNQFDPTKPGYISPKDFCSGTDAEFCTNVALTSIEVFNDFLKTL